MLNAVLTCAFVCVSSVMSAPLSEPAWAGAVRPVPASAVEAEGFWSERIDRVHRVTIPHIFEQCERTGRIENFEVAARRRPGGHQGYVFNDSDVYKLIEGVAGVLAVRPDPALESRVDALIASIAAAQEPDGYLYTSRTILDPAHMPLGGKERWSDMAHGHELYCAGHLYEAAVAYHQVTGKRALLDVALRNAELVRRVFGPGKNPHPCGHPEIELALVRLADHTGRREFLELAAFFLDTRGRLEGRVAFGEYAQDHLPLSQQTEIVGHAVRGAYLFAGLTDVGLRTGDRERIDASQRLWHDMVSTKLSLTGGVGSRAANEGFGSPFELPNADAYNETCAAIAVAMWSHRLFLARAHAEHADLVERVIYNAFHSGWGLSGDRFFYPNPLASPGAERAGWFKCACCPPNVCRFVPSIPGMAYARSERELYVVQFIAGRAEVPLAAGPVVVTQRTEYPWQGVVTIQVEPAAVQPFDLLVRIPGWARGQAAPGGLYRFTDPEPPQPTIAVNGTPITRTTERGFVRLSREWKPGDTVTLDLPMPPRRVQADPRVAACRGYVALQRGPMVYAVEGLDHPGHEPTSLVLDPAPLAQEHRPGLLGGVTVLTGRARTGPTDAPLMAIPYYAWANRGRTPMAVWLAAPPESSPAQPSNP